MDTEPDHPNLFLPHRALLAATNLRLSHCLVHSADSALVACEEGLMMLKQSSLSDPCLLAELLVQKGTLLLSTHIFLCMYVCTRYWMAV